MPEDPALVRQWRLIKILSGKRLGAGVRELAEELHVAEKTIRRDLQTFVDVGFPLEQRSGAHGRDHATSAIEMPRSAHLRLPAI